MDNIKPTFIVIGPGRTGTTWLYEVLREHPEVGLAHGTKETNFFNWEFDKGEEWYLKFFEKCDNKKAVGEVSNLYFYEPEKVAERIKDLYPEIKLITILRDPIDRIESVFLYRKRGGEIPMEMTIEEAINKYPELTYVNNYYTNISSFYKYFNKDQFLITFYDDIKENPKEVTRDIYEFIGVNEGFKPSVLNKMVNQAAQLRIPVAQKFLDLIANSLRKLELFSLLNYLKRNKLVRKVILKDIKREKNQIINRDLRVALLNKYKTEIEGVEKITGKNLEHWKLVD